MSVSTMCSMQLETAQESGLGDKGQGWHSESTVLRAVKRERELTTDQEEVL